MSTTLAPATPATEKRPNFGNGRFSPQMEELFDKSQDLLGFTPTQAERFARQAANDAGAVLKNAPAAFKVGTVNAKSNTASISDAAKVKSVTLTYALNIVRALQWIDDAGKNGISYGHTKWKLMPGLQKWVDELVA